MVYSIYLESPRSQIRKMGVAGPVGKCDCELGRNWEGNEKNGT